MKIAYNDQYGGFQLSDKAYHYYAKLKGITLYPEKNMGFVVYWTTSPDERGATLDSDKFHESSMEERKKSNAVYTDETLNLDEVDRTDTLLIQTIEELGDETNALCATLKIAELEDGAQYRIQEYDGLEWIETPDDIEWKTA